MDSFFLRDQWGKPPPDIAEIVLLCFKPEASPPPAGESSQLIFHLSGTA